MPDSLLIKRTINILRYILVVIVVSTSLKSYADASSSVWLGPSIKSYDFREFDREGSRLNKESGLLPGFTGGASQTSGSYSYHAILAYHSNDIHHDGQTQAGVPIKTRTDESIFDGVVQVKKMLHAKDALHIALFGGIGYHYWERDIRGTDSVSGLFETYDWLYVEAGISANHEHFFNSEWGMELSLIWPFNPEVEVEFPGKLDNARLDLGSRTAIRAALSWKRELHGNTEIQIEPFFEYRELGRSSSTPLSSEGNVVGSVFSPRNETRIMGVAVTISRHF